jgi:hypothetical protein
VLREDRWLLEHQAKQQQPCTNAGSAHKRRTRSPADPKGPPYVLPTVPNGPPYFGMTSTTSRGSLPALPNA